MATKLRVILDPHFRKIDEIFSPADLDRLHSIVEVIWGRDQAMPLDAARIALEDAGAIISGGWRYLRKASNKVPCCRSRMYCERKF